MRTWWTLVVLCALLPSAFTLGACAESVYYDPAPPMDRPDLGPPPPDLGPPDLGPPDMGPDLGPCGGAATCCGDRIVQSNEKCEPNPSDGGQRCPVNPATDCSQSGGTMCIVGSNCQAECVPQDGLDPTQNCP